MDALCWGAAAAIRGSTCPSRRPTPTKPRPIEHKTGASVPRSPCPSSWPSLCPRRWRPPRARSTSSGSRRSTKGTPYTFPHTHITTIGPSNLTRLYLSSDILSHTTHVVPPLSGRRPSPPSSASARRAPPWGRGSARRSSRSTGPCPSRYVDDRSWRIEWPAFPLVMLLVRQDRRT